MNQPTEERFKRIEEEQRKLKEEVRQLREQRTEEIKAVRVEVASEDVINRMKTLEKGQKETKEDTTVLKDDVGVLKIEMQGARGDILSIKATQSDHGEYLKEDRQTQKHHGDKLDQHTDVLGQLVGFAESHDALLKDMKAAQDEQGKKLDRILSLLEPRGE